MADFDYGNARLRAARARLLPRARLVELAGARSVEVMLAGLYESPYRIAVESALVRFTGLAALGAALRRDLHDVLGRQRAYYRGRAALAISWLLRRYDVYNVRTILRGVSRGEPASDIVAQTVPVGDLTPSQLTVLSGADSAAGVAGMLATYRSPLARPLLDLAAEEPYAPLWRKEMALLRWWARAAWPAHPSPSWYSALSTLIDAENIMTALRLVTVSLPAENLAAQWIELPEAGSRLISTDLLSAVARSSDVRTAVSHLAPTPYGAILAEISRANEQPSHFEVALIGFRVRQAPQLIARDPLGIGVPLGFHELKSNESRNLRLIGHGIFVGEPADEIVSRLVTV